MYLAIAIQLSTICIIQSATQTDTQDCSGCCTSAAGIPGIPGSHGAPGAPGSIGMKGDVGAKGDKADQGIDGLQGKIGPIGLPGAIGVKGERGENGEKGNQGLDGSDGLPGKIGPTGLPGATGDKGERGEKGEQATTNSQPKSAFSVAYDSNPGRLPTSPMKYPLIITNFGNHYNKETGKFVCQHPGIYIFQFTSQSSSNSDNSITTIKKNGQLIVSSWESGSDYKSASNMVVLELEANDEVWTEPINTSYYYSNSNIYCTFSGFLLYASS